MAGGTIATVGWPAPPVWFVALFAPLGVAPASRRCGPGVSPGLQITMRDLRLAALALATMVASLVGCVSQPDQHSISRRPTEFPSWFSRLPQSSDIFDGELRSLRIDNGCDISCELVLRPKVPVLFSRKRINTDGIRFFFQGETGVYQYSYLGTPPRCYVTPFERRECVSIQPGYEWIVCMAFSTTHGWGAGRYHFELVSEPGSSLTRLPPGRYWVYYCANVPYFPVTPDTHYQYAEWLIRSATPVEVGK